MVSGRVRWHLGDSASQSAGAFPESSGQLQRVASQADPADEVHGGLMDGFDRTTSSRRTLCPGARRGPCLRHALNKLPDKLRGLSAPLRPGWRAQFHTLGHRCRTRTRLRGGALGQRLRRFADHITAPGGAEQGERVRSGFQAKKAGW
jgi:hypothetical protein